MTFSRMQPEVFHTDNYDGPKGAYMTSGWHGDRVLGYLPNEMMAVWIEQHADTNAFCVVGWAEDGGDEKNYIKCQSNIWEGDMFMALDQAWKVGLALRDVSSVSSAAEIMYDVFGMRAQPRGGAALAPVRLPAGVRALVQAVGAERG